MEQTYRHGDSGPAVAQIADLLRRLGLIEDPPPEEYDDRVENAVRAFQQQRGLTVDGVVGASTFRRLDEARWRLGDRILTHLPGRPMAGDDVYALQQRLLELGFSTGRADGYFGARTEAGVRDFQRNVGLPPDGTCGPATLKALARLSPIVRGGSLNGLRAEERVRQEGPQLSGKIVVLDPARGDNLPASLVEQSDAVIHDLAHRIEGRLVATGVQAFLTTARNAPSGTADEPAAAIGRARFANAAHANLVVSLALDASSSPDACGAASYYFGSDTHGTFSTLGERFAGLVQREIVARTDLVDLRTHPKSWDLLRHTRMPAVRVEPGYLTHAGDAARLRDPDFRDVLAEAVVVAIQRFYLSPEIDPHTGALPLQELRSAIGHA